MRALVITGPEAAEFVDVPKPHIMRPDDVLVKVKAAGICGSDIKIRHGANSAATYPRIPGHEVTGEIVEVGESVQGFAAGDRVVLEPIVACGHCYACRLGRENVCLNLAIRGVTLDGGWCEYIVAPVDRLHRIPDSVSWRQAVMIEPYTLGEQALTRTGARPDDVVVIIGLGPIGLVVLDVFKRHGIERVIAVDMIPGRLETARRFGANDTIDAKTENTAERLRELTGGMGANIVIDATGAPALFAAALDMASPAGVVLPMAFSAVPVEIAAAAIGKKELTVVGSRLSAGKFPIIIADFERYADHIDELVTHVYPFTQALEAMDKAECRDASQGKVVMLMEDEHA